MFEHPQTASEPAASSTSTTRFALPDNEFHDLLQRPSIELQLFVEQCLGDSEFALSLLEEFVNILPDRQAAIVRANSETNFGELTIRSHALKGASGYVAASRLNQLCARLEQAAIANQIDQARELVPQVCEEIERCIREYPRLRQKLSANN